MKNLKKILFLFLIVTTVFALSVTFATPTVGIASFVSSPDLTTSPAGLPDSPQTETFVPVAEIIEVPANATTDLPLTLFGTVLPADATNQTIIWSVTDAGETGAILKDGVLTVAAAGTVVVTAKVKDGLQSGVAAMAAGGVHTVAIKNDGSLWAWGWNGDGQLGYGTYESSSLPVQVGTDTDWAAVAVGEQHTLALKRDGSLWAWGANNNGQLGDGTEIKRNVPGQVGEENEWAAVTAGGGSTMAIKTDGSLWAWGSNNNGQLGDGTTRNRSEPVQVQTDEDDVWTAVSMGATHTIAITKNNNLWAWGRNTEGQLGDGTNTRSSFPVQVGKDEDWAEIAAGYLYSVALKNDGSLWTWGDNTYGQLGDGTSFSKNTPTQVETADEWAAVSTGNAHTIALSADGYLWAWGYNDTGQLGDNSTVNRNKPVRVGIAYDWAVASAGTYHTLALNADGNLWAWGFNLTGQLGDGTNTQHNSPRDIISSKDYTKDFTITVGESSDIIMASGEVIYQSSKRPATITLYNNEGEYVCSTDTDADGAYTLKAPADISDTGYTLKVTKNGYLSYTIKNLTLTAGEVLGPIDISPLAGDVNGDGIVNSIDLTYLLSEFNRYPLMYPDADINDDGLVNSIDLTYLLAGFNKRDVEVEAVKPPSFEYTSAGEDTPEISLEVFSQNGLIEMVDVAASFFMDPPLASAMNLPEFEIVKLLDNGPDSENIVLSILGDGFTASQQDHFVQSAKTISEYLINFFPFNSFKNKFNVYAIKVISNVSGAAARPSALIDNYFGSSYFFDGVTQRLLYTTYPSKVYQVLNTHTPQYNIPIVLVNATAYGGGGGSFAVTSLEASAKEILVHELGHSVGGLADEYWWQGYEAPNLTRDNNPATNKWKHWLGFESVGLYPYPESPTWYRPHQNCEMRYLNRAFCEVCTTQLTKVMANITNDPFFGRSDLTNAIIPFGTAHIGDYTYYGCEDLTTVTIPGTVTSIGRYAFLRCTSLTSVTNLATTPQNINNTTFGGVDRSSIYLYVPQGTAAAYRAAGWTGFKDITELTFAASGAVICNPSTIPAMVTLYDSTGNIVYSTSTNADGAYTLTAPTGSGPPYTLTVTKPGYLSYTIKNLPHSMGQEIEAIDLSQLGGDVNGDGIVNSTDLTYLLSEFNRFPILYPNADIDGNGIVNSVDLTYLLAGFNKKNVVIER